MTHERCRSQLSRSRKTPCIFGGIHTCAPIDSSVPRKSSTASRLCSIPTATWRDKAANTPKRRSRIAGARDCRLACAGSPRPEPCPPCARPEVDGGYYWDGLYSQNPPVREFLAGVRKEETPDELWILRINPQHVRSNRGPTPKFRTVKTS